MAKKKSSVLIVDDHPAMSVGLQLLLEKAGFSVVGTVDRASSAVAAVKTHSPEVVLLDTVMPGGDPFAAAERILKASPETRVVFYSAEPSDNLLDKANDIGAAGFISKGESQESLVFALQQICSGQKYFSPEFQRRLVRTRGIQPRSRLSTLSPRELEVLRLLAQDYSVREVAEQLGVRPTTIETHRQSLRAKLDLRGAAGMARFAIREGLLEA